MKKTLKIGISSDGYNEKRNFIDLPYNQKIEFIKKYDLLKPYNHLLFKLKGRVNPNYNYRFIDHFFNRGIDLYHFFGSIYQGKKNWVVTSDVILPRWTKNHKKAIKLFAKKNCSKIIFTSKIVYERQLFELEKYPQLKNSIEKKMVVLYPSQKPLIKSYDEKPLGPKIRLTLVGHRILGKGGFEIIHALEELWNEFPIFELWIVSKLHTVDYLKNEKTDERLEIVKNKIKSNSHFIHHVESMNQAEVHSLLKSTHVALLPSYDDSFGYFVLEAQACGCPIITTDIMAFPEINNTKKGWMIEVPKSTFRRPDALTIESYLHFSSVLFKNLKKILRDIFESPSLIKAKGEIALSEIKSNFQPAKNAHYLEKIYEEIQPNN